MNAPHTPTPITAETISAQFKHGMVNARDSYIMFGDYVSGAKVRDDLRAALAEAVDIVDKCGFGGSNAAREKIFLKRARAALAKAGAA